MPEAWDGVAEAESDAIPSGTFHVPSPRGVTL